MNPLRTVIVGRKALVLADQAIFSGASFVLTLVMARLLPISAFGLYGGIFLWLYLLTSISSALTSQPVQVSYSRHANPQHYLRFMASFQLAVTGLLVLVSACVIRIMFPDLQAFLAEIIFLGVGFLMHDFNRKVLLTKDRAGDVLALDGLMAAIQCLFLGLAWAGDAFSLQKAFLFTAASFFIPAIVGMLRIQYGIATPGDWVRYFPKHWADSRWLLLTACVQWCSANMFIVGAGAVLGTVALGAFRLVQSLFGILNLLLQTFENYALPQAARIFQHSFDESRRYLRHISLKTAAGFTGMLVVLFVFADGIIVAAGGEQYRPFAFVVKGMVVLYAIIFLGYPVRMAIRLLVLNRIFFAGYLITFLISLLSFRLLLSHWQLWGAILGLIVNQLVLIGFWQYHLTKKEFVLWK